MRAEGPPKIRPRLSLEPLDAAEYEHHKGQKMRGEEMQTSPFLEYCTRDGRQAGAPSVKARRDPMHSMIGNYLRTYGVTVASSKPGLQVQVRQQSSMRYANGSTRQEVGVRNEMDSRLSTATEGPFGGNSAPRFWNHRRWGRFG